MGLYGDLTSLSLPDLLQKLEPGGQTGLLAVEHPRGKVFLYIREGKVAMLARDGRPSFVDALSTLGVLNAKQIDTVRKKRRGSGTSLIDTMIELLGLEEEKLRALGEELLTEEFAELLLLGEGTFTFEEGGIPQGVFDAEENRLGLALRAGPLLLEASRRADMAREARRVIPNDGLRLVPIENGIIPAEIEDIELAQEVLARLDGIRTLREVLDLFTGRRLNALQTIASLFHHQVAKVPDVEDVLAWSNRLKSKEPARALKLVEDALQRQPQHLGLLAAAGNLSLALKDGARAAAHLKPFAFLKLQAGEKDEALNALRLAEKLTPADTDFLERLLDLQLQERLVKEARVIGDKLVALYRAPGLHARARAVLEKLLHLEPESSRLRLELAHSQVDSGDAKGAVKSLMRHGKDLLGRAEYPAARQVFEEVLEIETKNAEAARHMQRIDTDDYRRRRERRQRWTQRAAIAVVLAGATWGAWLDLAARLAYAEAESAISEEKLIEQKNYAEALERLRAVGETHRHTLAYFLEIRSRIEDLEAKVKAGK